LFFLLGLIILFKHAHHNQPGQAWHSFTRCRGRIYLKKLKRENAGYQPKKGSVKQLALFIIQSGVFPVQ
jgi:hypothetical protein